VKKTLLPAVAHGAAILLAALIESAWLSRLAVHGATPDLVLLWVVALGFYRGAEVGAIAGAAAGWLHDLLGGLALGLHALVKMIVGFATGLLRRTIVLEGVVVPALVGVGASVSSDVLLQIIASITGSGPREWAPWMERAAWAACYNGLMSPVVFWVFLRLERRLQRIRGDE